METRYHQHHGHYIPHCGGEGVLNTANSKANDRTSMRFMPLSPSILGVCRRSKYARWRDTIDEDDTWIWGLDSMIKPSAAPDYIYHAAMVRNLRWWLAVGVFFHFDTTTFQFRPKKYFLASFGFLPLRLGMSPLPWWSLFVRCKLRFAPFCGTYLLKWQIEIGYYLGTLVRYAYMLESLVVIFKYVGNTSGSTLRSK
mgnify:CR=1 FL=1